MRPARIREVGGRLTRAPVMVRAAPFAELDLMHATEIYGTIGGIDTELPMQTLRRLVVAVGAVIPFWS